MYAGLRRFHGSTVVQKRLAQHEALAKQRSKHSPPHEHIGGPCSRWVWVPAHGVLYVELPENVPAGILSAHGCAGTKTPPVADLHGVN